MIWIQGLKGKFIKGIMGRYCVRAIVRMGRFMLVEVKMVSSRSVRG